MQEGVRAANWRSPLRSGLQAGRVVVLGYDVWQRALGGRRDVVGSVATLGNIPATVIGLMPDGFGYPVNHDAWTPPSLRASYGALEAARLA